jgi:transposase-like protein
MAYVGRLWSKEIRTAAVALYRRGGRSIREVSAAFGIPDSTLRRWLGTCEECLTQLQVSENRATSWCPKCGSAYAVGGAAAAC